MIKIINYKITGDHSLITKYSLSGEIEANLSISCETIESLRGVSEAGLQEIAFVLADELLYTMREQCQKEILDFLRPYHEDGGRKRLMEEMKKSNLNKWTAPPEMKDKDMLHLQTNYAYWRGFIAGLAGSMSCGSHEIIQKVIDKVRWMRVDPTRKKIDALKNG